MALFHYPKAIHKRTQSPPVYKRYQSYKPYLQTEFDHTCVYCRTPDWLSDKNYFAVEHYKPKSLFPLLETEYTNLFYSCGTCNGRKGTFWPNKKQKEEETFILNPCDYKMHKHLRSRLDGKVTTHSFAGEWTKEILGLNEPIWVEKRRFYISQNESLENTRVRTFASSEKFVGSFRYR